MYVVKTQPPVISFAFLSAVGLFSTPVALAQDKRSPDPPVQATVCQLETNPNAYNHKLVEVRGRVYFGKFDFFIDSSCKPNSGARVWLDVGGDLVSPAQYWGITTFLPKRKGVDVQVEGIRVPLVHDALLDEFVNDVGATRFQKPNGDGCGSECLFYEVTATLKGRFFSGTRGGYGMEKCCNLLVIEKVVRVSSKRTSVPVGGEFQCTSDRWQPTPEERKALSAIPECSLGRDFKNCYSTLAKHWSDTINPKDGLNYPGPWMSTDMTKSYKFSGGFIQKESQSTEMTPSSSVVREVCRTVNPPKPPSDHVYCSFYRARGPDKNAALDVQRKVAAGETWRSSDMEQVGWLAFKDASLRWKLTAPVQVEPAKCEPWPAGKDEDGNEQQWGYCSWLAKDGLQQINVTLQKPGYLARSTGHLQSVAWIAIDVEANLCRTEPEQH